MPGERPIGLLLLTLCCGLAIWPVYRFSGLPHTPVPYVVLAFFAGINWLAMRLRQQASKEPKAAVRTGMAIITGKLALTMAMLLVVMLTSRGTALLLPHTFTFLALYVLFLLYGTFVGIHKHGSAA